MPFLFQNLRVYQQALEFADEVSVFTTRFARANWYVGDQFNRASLSIALNIAESSGRMTDADKRRFLTMARGSGHECAALPDVCGRPKLLTDAECTQLDQHLTTISKMLSGMIEHYSDAERVGEEQGDYLP